jgi:hypothetical protein
MNIADNKRAGAAYEKLEAATKTLEREAEFFHALMESSPAAEIANRIVMFTAVFKLAGESVPKYLSRKHSELFHVDSMGTASRLTILLNEINRSVRLAAYLSVKGVFPQALAVLRGSVESIGVYTHVWHHPEKAKFVIDSDSNDYGRAFRWTSDAKLQKTLKTRGISYRFMHCAGAREFSKLYKLLSAHAVHGIAMAPIRSESLSCEFVDRPNPDELIEQYGVIQTLLAMLLVELVKSIPEDDHLDDDIGAFVLAALIFTPTLGSSPGKEDPRLKAAVEELLKALANARRRELEES